MSGLLLPARPRSDAPTGGARRATWLLAAAAGVTAALGGLMLCLTVALAGWFASDAGAHGDTRDALRVGADAWLLAHGADLRVDGASITAVPLGLTALCLLLAFRAGRWAGHDGPERPADLVAGSAVLAACYAVVAVVAAVLASVAATPVSGPGALAGGLAVGLVGGGGGLVAGSPAGRAWLAGLPEPVRAVAVGAAATALLLTAAGSVLAFGALLADLGAAANVLSLLHPDPAGAALYTVVVAATSPNLALLAGAYLLGPGFAVGSGTVVSPAAVVLGPVPAFPPLAALPDAGPGPAWAPALVGVPAVLAALAGVLLVRRFPDPRLDAGALRGLAAGVVGGALVTVLVRLAGGAVGPGRMADVGAPPGEVLVAAVAIQGLGCLVGALLMTALVRRRTRVGDGTRRGGPDHEDTVIL